MSSKERDKLQALTHLSSIRVVYANQIHLCFVLLRNKDNMYKYTQNVWGHAFLASQGALEMICVILSD